MRQRIGTRYLMSSRSMNVSAPYSKSTPAINLRRARLGSRFCLARKFISKLRFFANMLVSYYVMVDAPIHTRRWTTLCLIATLVLGGFSFVAPVHASMASMPQAGSMDSTPSTATACFAQGCTQTHDTCKQHCVRPSSEPGSMDVAVTVQSNQEADSESVQRFSMTFPESATVYVPILDRAPPIHTFLRSVIKRE